MIAIVWNNAALLTGMALLMLGHGLQSTLLGVRASIESFPTSVTGIIMSGYFIGFLFGSLATPRLVKRVGHVRVFAAVVSLASAAALVHVLLVNPAAWFFTRLLTGICFSTAYIVAESWLNGATDNANRGKLLSVYMVVQLMAMSVGQFILPLGDPAGFKLFLVISVLISLSVIPLLLSAQPAPVVSAPRVVGILQLYHVSPLGIVGMAMVGVSMGGLFTMGSVFGQAIGFSLTELSSMLAAASLGGMLLQWPIGHMSDRADRRKVITAVTFLAAASLLGPTLVGFTSSLSLIAAFFLFGGLLMPMYALFVAHTNDYLEPDQMVAASGALVLANGIGAAFGPSILAFAMDMFGPQGFIYTLIAIHLLIGAFALYRMTKRVALPLDEQGSHVYIPSPTAVTVPWAQEEAYELASESEEELSEKDGAPD